MAIAYSGTLIDAQLTQSAGTRVELADWLHARLLQAGWSQVSTATGDHRSQCVASPAGLACRVRVYDPGSGNCARVRFSNVTDTQTQTNDHFLLPAAGKTWRFVGGPHQFFLWVPSVVAARNFLCGGVPYLPAALSGVVTNCIWSQASGTSDTDTATRVDLRSAPAGRSGNAGTVPNTWNAIGSDAWGIGASDGIGSPRLVAMAGGYVQDVTAYRWHNDALIPYEPLLAWGSTGQGVESKIRGQLWDSLVLSDSFPDGTTIGFDGRSWINMTVSNNGSSVYARGTLFIALP